MCLDGSQLTVFVPNAIILELQTDVDEMNM